MAPVDLSSLTASENTAILSAISLMGDIPDINYNELARMIGQKYSKNAKATCKRAFEKICASVGGSDNAGDADAGVDDDNEGPPTKKKALAKPASKPAAKPAAKRAPRGKASKTNDTPADDEVNDADVSGPAPKVSGRGKATNANGGKVAVKDAAPKAPKPPAKRAPRAKKIVEAAEADEGVVDNSKAVKAAKGRVTRPTATLAPVNLAPATPESAPAPELDDETDAETIAIVEENGKLKTSSNLLVDAPKTGNELGSSSVEAVPKENMDEQMARMHDVPLATFLLWKKHNPYPEWANDETS